MCCNKKKYINSKNKKTKIQPNNQKPNISKIKFSSQHPILFHFFFFFFFFFSVIHHLLF